LINREKLISCCGFESDEQLRKSHQQWVEEALRDGGKMRQPEWTESIALGSEEFVNHMLEQLGRRVPGRNLAGGVDYYELREQVGAYSVIFTPENGLLSDENRFPWDD
jgi:hypothetical protein